MTKQRAAERAARERRARVHLPVAAAAELRRRRARRQRVARLAASVRSC
jgi:hypothetical protein